MPLINQTWGAYTPEDIPNSIFLSLIKKAFNGGIGGRRQNYTLFLDIIIFSALPLICHAPGAEYFREGRQFCL